MTTVNSAVVLVPDANERAEHWSGRMSRRNWGDGVTAACAVSALVDGATELADCMSADWPDWLPAAVLDLYDRDVGVRKEQEAADEWFSELAAIVACPVDYGLAQHHFAVALLKSVSKVPSLTGIVAPMIALHERVVAGGNVTETEWDETCDASFASGAGAVPGSAEDFAGQAGGCAVPTTSNDVHTWMTVELADDCAAARTMAAGRGMETVDTEYRAVRAMLLAALRAAGAH